MTEIISIRPAKLAEQKTLEALQWRASLMWEEYRDALIATPDAIELPVEQICDGRVLIAETNNKIVGFAVILPRADGNADLDGLFVDPMRWRAGIGTRLIKAADILAMENDARFLHVVGNPRAADFYYACGFILIGEESTRFGVGLAMRKPCDAQS